MTEKKINIYKNNGSLVGYFKEPKISQYGEDEYEINGLFQNAEGGLVAKLDFNPQSLPYWAEIKGISAVKHSQLTNIYVQRCRQPVVMSGLGL